MSGAPGTPRPMYLRGSGDPVFAFLHPGAGPSRRTAVLMCPPFGWEDMCCYRIRRDWAQDLAQSGYTTLRIDLPGSGDSGGAPTGAGQLDAWTTAVAQAARWLLRRPRVGGEAPASIERVTAIGIGLGGLVACRAALTGAPIAELALWAVPAKGRRLLRELRAFSAFEVANNQDEDDLASPSGGIEDGALSANGYLMSAETVAALEGLDLTTLAPQLGSPARPDLSPTASRPTSPRLGRALVLGRDGMKVSGELTDLLAGAGAEVRVADGPGYGAMMVEPQDARTPVEAIELVRCWLEEGEAEGPAPEPAAELCEPATAALPARAARAMPKASEQVTMEWAGAEISERPLLLEGPEGPMFAILTEPVSECGALTAVLLNAGPQRRVGPNRMWVETARRWAARGVPSLRLDCSGIGDSEGDPTVLARVTEFYRPTYAEQAQAAVQALTEMGLPQRFVMLGLCAGSYWSVQTALADERVARVIMLNPRTLVFDEWRHAKRRTRELREKALRPQTWRKVLTGDIKVAKHLETGRTLVGRAVGAPARVGARTRGESVSEAMNGSTESDPLEGLFDALRERDQRALLLFTGKEVLRQEMTDRGMLERMDRWPNLKLVIGGTSADTHTLTPVWLQRQVHELLDRALEEELARCTTT